MDLIHRGNGLRKSASIYGLSVIIGVVTIGAVIVDLLLLLKTRNNPKIIVSVMAAFIITLFVVYKRRKRLSLDRIYIFFYEEEKRGILTFARSSINTIKVISGDSECKTKAPYVMLATLNKAVLGAEKNGIVERNINLRGYMHSCDYEKSDVYGAPQMIINLNIKARNTTLETGFFFLKDKNLLLNVKSRKFEECTNIPHSLEKQYLEKVFTLSIGKQPFLSILLENYLSEENFPTDFGKAVYLLCNFKHMLPRLLITSLRKNIKELSKASSGLCDSEDLENLKVLLDSECSPSTLRHTTDIADSDSISLKADVLELIKRRACEYDNLHEALVHEQYGNKRPSIGIEEIIACYPDKAGSYQTSALLRKLISNDRVLTSSMKLIHGYMDICKKASGDMPYSQSGQLSENRELGCFIESNKLEKGDLSNVISCARKKVVQKYQGLFLDDISGILVKVTLQLHKVWVNLEKFEFKNCDADASL